MLTEKHFTHSDFLLHAIPIGGFRMLDGDEADDKIIAVMQQDAVYGGWNDLKSVPVSTIERLRHYFLTYKDAPGAAHQKAEITHVYGRVEAHDIIRRSQEDYRVRFGVPGERLARLVGQEPAATTIADPFEPTAEVVALLELRRDQIASADGERRSRARGLRGLLRGLVREHVALTAGSLQPHARAVFHRRIKRRRKLGARSAG